MEEIWNRLQSLLVKSCYTSNPRKSVACLIEQKGDGLPWALGQGTDGMPSVCYLSFNTAILHTKKKNTKLMPGQGHFKLWCSIDPCGWNSLLLPPSREVRAGSAPLELVGIQCLAAQRHFSRVDAAEIGWRAVGWGGWTGILCLKYSLPHSLNTL